MYKLNLFLVLVVTIFSCASVVPVYDPGVSVERYFRYAQDARNSGRIRNAMQYYDLIIKNFEGRPDKVIIAQYEKGAIYHKNKEYKKAVELFDIVLAGANDPRVGPAIPPAVVYLARALKKDTEDKLYKKGKLLDAG